jgi:aldose 1-epimerase
VNVALGFATLDEYVAHRGHYFGATVGRYANRISGARFELDGREVGLDPNDRGHCLHGGAEGFDRQTWEVAEVACDSVTLRRTSPDGEMGFPGNLDVEVRYALEGATLRIDFRAETDAPTLVNMTNHTSWNLAGEGSGTVDDHTLQVWASAYTPVGPDLVPTGDVAPVERTPLDLRAPRRLGDVLRTASPDLAAGRGLDHNFVLDRAGEGLRPAARLEHPASGRSLELHTTEPGLQVYTGNFLDGTLVGTSGRAYRQGDGIALEPQHPPDAPNQPHFPGTVLCPGETYTSSSVYRFD